MNKKNNKALGRKGSSGSTAVQSDYRSAAMIRVDLAVAQGPVVGLVNGGQSILLDGTPLIDSAGNYNFPRASFTERTGALNQAPIPGFETGVENVVDVGTEVKAANPVIVSTTDKSVNAARVTFSVGPLFEDNGSKQGSVEYAVDIRPLGGVWTTVSQSTFTKVIRGAAEFDVYVPLPNVDARYDLRARKITAEPADTKSSNTLAFSRFTEVIDGQLTYPGLAHVGLFFDAGSVGNDMPVPSFIGDWAIVRIPTTYDPVARTYAGGIWDQTFKSAWTDNPVWCLLDYLTDVDNGLGAFFPDSRINLQSFYTAAQYCDERLSFTTEAGTVISEPRFTLNGGMATAEAGTHWIDAICNVMHGNCVWSQVS